MCTLCFHKRKNEIMAKGLDIYKFFISQLISITLEDIVTLYGYLLAAAQPQVSKNRLKIRQAASTAITPCCLHAGKKPCQSGLLDSALMFKCKKLYYRHNVYRLTLWILLISWKSCILDFRIDMVCCMFSLQALTYQIQM